MHVNGESLFWNHLKAAHDGTLPKILLTDGFFPLNLVRAIVLTDFDVINKAFKNPAISSRFSSHRKTDIEFATQVRCSGLKQYADSIGLKTGNTKKANECPHERTFKHIGLNSNKCITVTVTGQHFSLTAAANSDLSGTR